MNQSPLLLLNIGEKQGQRWTIDKKELLVGRGTDCDIVLPEREVSRHHMKIWLENDLYYIQDLGSKNGTFLNGRSVLTRQPLKDGDEIRLAHGITLLYLDSDTTVPLPKNLLAPTSSLKLQLNSELRSTIYNDVLLDPALSAAQFKLLHHLYAANGAVCTRDDIIGSVWPDADGTGVSEQAIDALIRRLRDRLAELTDDPIVLTVRGHGFRLNTD